MWDSDLHKVAILRLDAITYGVAIAKLYRERSRIVNRPGLLLAIGLTLIVGQWLVFMSLDPSAGHAVGIYSLETTPLAFSLCLPAMLRIRRLPGVLAWLARYLSARAYVLYLVHLSLLEAISLAYVRLGLSAATCIAISVVSIFGLSQVLHVWVEVPIMRRRPRQYPTGVLARQQPAVTPAV